MIDLALQRTGKGKHPLSSCVDEIVPVNRGGSITEPTNLRHAHATCNGSRGTHALVPWDPGWDYRTKEPDEVRARCRALVEATLNTQPTISRTW